MSKHPDHHGNRSHDRPQHGRSRRFLQILAGVAVSVFLIIGFTLSRSPAPTPQQTSAPPLQTTGLPEGETPDPYYYDEENDRWWHEQGAHGHWHPGPPPVDERN